MNAYPLAALLSLRDHRERQAAREAAMAAKAVEKASEKLRAADHERDQYKAWRPGEEKRLFAELLNKNVPPKEIDKHREDVDELRQRELSLEETAKAAAKDLEKAEQALVAAKEKRLRIIRDRDKLIEHRTRWQAEESRRAEAAEDLDLEDFRQRAMEEEAEKDADLEEELISADG